MLQCKCHSYDSTSGETQVGPINQKRSRAARATRAARGLVAWYNFELCERLEYVGGVSGTISELVGSVPQGNSYCSVGPD